MSTATEPTIRCRQPQMGLANCNTANLTTKNTAHQPRFTSVFESNLPTVPKSGRYHCAPNPGDLPQSPYGQPNGVPKEAHDETNTPIKRVVLPLHDPQTGIWNTPLNLRHAQTKAEPRGAKQEGANNSEDVYTNQATRPDQETNKLSPDEFRPWNDTGHTANNPRPPDQEATLKVNRTISHTSAEFQFDILDKLEGHGLEDHY